MRARIVYFLWLMIVIYMTIFSNCGFTLLVISLVCPVVGIVINLHKKVDISAKIEDINFEKGENVLVKLMILGNGNLVKGELICENSLNFETKISNVKGYATKEGMCIELKLKSESCGRINFRFDTLKRYDIFGLVYKNMKLDVDGLVYCLPNLLKIDLSENFENSTMNGVNLFRSNYGISDHSEIDDIKKYAFGDSKKDIHWKMSFRFNDLYIKKYSTERCLNICLFLETGIEKNLESFDKNAEKILSLSWTLLEIDTPHFVVHKNQKNGNLYFDFVDNLDSYHVAQSRILDANPKINPKTFKEFSELFRNNQIKHIITVEDNVFKPVEFFG